MTTDRKPHLFFAGPELRAYSLVAPIATDAARGTAGYGEFVLEHRKDGDSLVLLLTVEGEDDAKRPVTVSVAIPAAMVRDLLNRVPEATAEVQA
jgi:hypothetical protein